MKRLIFSVLAPCIALVAMADATPAGALTGLFSIDDASHQVQFAQGNLQYQASTQTWRFATNQWEYIGADNAKISESYAGWIDLFGWGTTGYHDADDALNTHYQPWENTMEAATSVDNKTGYGPSFGAHGTSYPGLGYDSYVGSVFANYDWGVYNTISNGGAKGSWRLLTEDEWIYLRDRQQSFEYKANPGDTEYQSKTLPLRGMSTLSEYNVYGLVLLPDNWTEDRDTWNGEAVVPATISNWANFAAKGAVFLPAAGYRGLEAKSSTSGTTQIREINTNANYWTSSPTDNNNLNAFCLDANSSNIELQSYNRFDGFAVRLVYAPQSEAWIMVSDRPADESAHKTVLTEKKTAATPINVHLKRTLYSDGWNTLCLPFTLTNAEWKAAFGTTAYVAKFASATLSDDKQTLNLNMTQLADDEEMTAGTPYIIIPHIDVVNPHFVNRTITMDAGSGETLPTTGDIQFLGLINRPNDMPHGNKQYLFVTATEELNWSKASDTSRMYGMRAYFYVPGMEEVKQSGAKARMVVRQAPTVTTGVETLQNSQVQVQKIIHNGQILIVREKKVYTVIGQEMEVAL